MNNNNIKFIETLKKQIIDCEFLHYDNVNDINIYSFFCIDNNIEYVKKNNIDISNNILNSNKLIKFIIDNNKQNNITFKLKCIYKYCFNINYTDILNLDFSNNYYSKVDIFNDIYFDDTINYFNKLNSIFIIYNSTNNNNKIQTKKQKSFFNKTRKYKL